MEPSAARIAIVVAWFGLLAGCNGPSSSKPAEQKAEAPASDKSATNAATKASAEWSANEILQKLLATYRQASTYQDQGVVRLAFKQGGQPVVQQWPTAVAWERPNKLSLTAYQATVKCDGRELRARIDDQVSNNVDNQFVVRPAPPQLKLADLASDALLYDLLSSQLRRQPIQLELLLESGGLVSAFSGEIACLRLENKPHDGHACFRVEVPSPGGPFVFWVDQRDWLLRRLDYPAAAIFPDMAQDPTISSLELIADLQGAQIGVSIPSQQFVLAEPPNAKRMRALAMPPRPLPSNVFGQQPEFGFTSASGNRVTKADLAGKIAILVWYHDHPACEATLREVSLARERLRDEPDVVAYAVATDPTTTTTELLTKRLAEWKAALPLVRDLEAFGDKSFHMEVQPTIVVLDKRQRVQIFEAGGYPQLADQLVAIVQRLSRGDDLAAEILARHERERREYDELVKRGGPEPGQVVELPEAVVHRRDEPKKLKLSPLWICHDLKSPGNILLLESPSQSQRIVVLEGWRTATEVDSTGRVVGRHELALPEQSAVTFFRTTTTKDGRRVFAASAPLAPQLFLFDEDWKLRLTYPPQNQTPLQIGDLAFATLSDGQDPALMIANVGEVGLIALSASGEVTWRNRAFPSAVSVVAPTAADTKNVSILVTGESGTILPVDLSGKDHAPVTVGAWPMLRLFAARFSSARKASLLGLSNNSKGEFIAVGLSSDLKECWNYPLAAGVHQKPIEAITSSHVLPGHQGEWWLGGPDGSIHVVTEDGELFDSFHYGEVLTGLAATRFGERAALLVATDSGLAAFEIQVSPEAKSVRER